MTSQAMNILDASWDVASRAITTLSEVLVNEYIEYMVVLSKKNSWV